MQQEKPARGAGFFWTDPARVTCFFIFEFSMILKFLNARYFPILTNDFEFRRLLALTEDKLINIIY
jgi:hypothetical protein